MRQDWHSLFTPIGIAQHGMALAVLVDNKLDLLAGYLADFVMQGFGKKITATAIDHHNALTCHDKIQIVVVTGIFISGGRRLTNR